MITILWWSFFGLIFILIWQRVAPATWRMGWKNGQDKESPYSVITVIFAILLTITVIFFLNQIWEDLNNLVESGQSVQPMMRENVIWTPPQPFYKSVNNSEQSELQRLFIHTGFTVPVLITALLAFLMLYRKGSAYAAVTLPYFVGAITLTLRLMYDAGYWGITYHHKFGIYIVLGTLLIVFSVLVFIVQQWWQRSSEGVHSGGVST